MRYERGLALIAMLMAIQSMVAQPPPPPRRDDARAVSRHIGDIRARLERTPPVDASQKELAGYTERYLDAAARLLSAGEAFQAQRMTEAADACRRPIDHMQHLGPKPLNPPPAPPLDDHLRRVYFRLRVSQVFLDEIPPPAPRRLLELARIFYERALHEQQNGHEQSANEYAASADDLTHALESLAQASATDNTAKLNP